MPHQNPPHTKWVPLLGEFSLDADSIVFRGGTGPIESGQTMPLVGNLISNQLFGGGVIEADITFHETPGKCGLILSYQPLTRSFVEVQLGGIDFCALWIHNDGRWTNYGRAGMGRLVEAGRSYHLRATVTGSQVAINIDGVDLLVTNLPEPLPRRQAGIWCESTSAIVINGFQVTPEKPTVFVVMQFSAPYDELYIDVIRPLCDELGLAAIRGDDRYGPGVIIQDIERQINEARIIVADISPINPNVYYEVGYAHALKKPTVLIAERPTELPFDVSAFRTLFYENTIAGKSKIEAGLRKHLEAIQNQW